MDKRFLDLKVKVDRKVKELHGKVPELIGRKIKPIEIKYDLHAREVGGSAYTNIVTGEQIIRLHPSALMEYGDQYIEDTVVHEFAHIVTANYKWDAKPHGAEWKMIMRHLGKEPNRCHEWNLVKCIEKHGQALGIKPEKIRKRRAERVIKYGCDCGMVHEVTARTHNKINRGATYVCNKCRSNLKIKE